MARKKEPQLVDINRAKIVNVAKRLFYDNGIDNTKVDDIAKEVGISKSTLYVYFNSKDDIKNYISLEAMRYLYEQVNKLIKDENGTFHDKFISICNIFVAFKEKYPLNFELIIEEIPVDDEVLRDDETLREIYEIGEELNNVILLYLQEELFISNETHKDAYKGDSINAHPDREAEAVNLIFFLWGSIYGICVLADNKEKYIQKTLKKSKEEFLHQSFEQLYKLLEERGAL